MKTRLNLGCGKKIDAEAVNLDFINCEGVDVIHDLNKFPYPFEDNTFEYIFCDNVLEHLNDIVAVMEELHRISKNKGRVEIIVPYFSSLGSFKDPTHKHFFTMETFNYFTLEAYYNFYSKARFRITERRLVFSERLKLFEWIFNPIWKQYQKFFSYLIPAGTLRFVLETIKETGS